MTSSNDPNFEPDQANVWFQNHDQTFARRTVKAIFVVGLIVFAFVFTLGWITGLDDVDVEANQTNSVASIAQQENPENRNAITAFFSDFYEGMYEGIYSANDRFRRKASMDTAGPMPSMTSTEPAAGEEQQFSNLSNGYRHSMEDVIGKTVIDENDEMAGYVHDIIIDKNTGDARVIIVHDNLVTESDLKTLNFSEILVQDTEGNVKAGKTDSEIERNPDFEYNKLNTDRYVSLKYLEHGQILDYEGTVTGEVDAVIYENAEAQHVYFQLDPSMVPAGKPSEFGLPYEAVNVVKSPDGYDIKLNKAQTEALAYMLYTEPTAE